MRALITGGAAFMGPTLAKARGSNGAAVVVPDNLSSGYHIDITGQPGVRLVEKDVRGAAADDAAVAGVDVIFHLAASVGNKVSGAFHIGSGTRIGINALVERLRAAGSLVGNDAQRDRGIGPWCT
jgi:UDP-glucose 4-epimerase